MKRSAVVIAVLIFFSALFYLASCNTEDRDKASEDPQMKLGNARDDTVRYGEYLVAGVGCHDCHSPKVMTPQGPIPDTTRLLSGHPAGTQLPAIDKSQLKSWYLFTQDLTAFVGPWGISYAANITSDDTGIGKWTEEQFIRAIRHGKFKGIADERTLLPPMPWPAFSNLTDTDLKAMFAYLKSTKPVKNVVPPAAAPADIP